MMFSCTQFFWRDRNHALQPCGITFCTVRVENAHVTCDMTLQIKARFKRRILHAPNRIAKLSACKMRRLNQLNATYFNSIRVSRIFD